MVRTIERGPRWHRRPSRRRSRPGLTPHGPVAAVVRPGRVGPRRAGTRDRRRRRQRPEAEGGRRLGAAGAGRPVLEGAHGDHLLGHEPEGLEVLARHLPPLAFVAEGPRGAVARGEAVASVLGGADLVRKAERDVDFGGDFFLHRGARLVVAVIVADLAQRHRHVCACVVNYFVRRMISANAVVRCGSGTVRGRTATLRIP